MDNSLVSIGMPIYNGERYMRIAIDSLLRQTYTHFTLTISDNASTDSTAQIALEYEKKDPRVRYLRNKTNVGMIKNYNQLFELSEGQYFMWAAYDDMWLPQYLEKCVRKLEENPDAMMCLTKRLFLDERGNTKSKHYPVADTTKMTLLERANIIFSLWGGWYPYGLYRPSYLRKTRLYTETTFFTDAVLALELLLLGDVVAIEEDLMYIREFDGRSPIHWLNQFSLAEEVKVQMAREPWTGLARELDNVIRISHLDDQTKSQLRNLYYHTLVNGENKILLNGILNESGMMPFIRSNKNSIDEFVKMRIFTDLSSVEIAQHIKRQGLLEITSNTFLNHLS